MKKLTKAEEEIMHVLWQIERGIVRQIINHLPEPKPAYTTVSTIIRILETKGFVKHKAYGKTHEYFPVISKDEYSKTYLNQFVNNYFSNSYKKLVSFFAQEENLSVKELNELKNIIDEEIKKQKKQ